MLSAFWLGTASVLLAQSSPMHYIHHGAMPPGAIGSQQLQRGGPLAGYFQPVEIRAPSGALVSLAVNESFESAQAAPRRVGLLIGAVYRIRVTNIRLAEGVEVFPTIELIDRLYTPVDQENRFAIPIDLTEEDLKLAAAGKFVTRVVYLEDSRRAMPTRGDAASNLFETAPGQDPLEVADGFGRPVAILRLGGRVPMQGETPDATFYYGSPPFTPLPLPTVPAGKGPVAPAPNVETLMPPRILPTPRSVVPREPTSEQGATP